MPRFLVVMRVFCDGDAYPALPGGIRILENLVSQAAVRDGGVADVSSVCDHCGYFRETVREGEAEGAEKEGRLRCDETGLRYRADAGSLVNPEYISF